MQVNLMEIAPDNADILQIDDRKGNLGISTGF